MLEKELGPEAFTEYHSMSEAVLIFLPSDCLLVTEGLEWDLKREDQEEFYLGFPEECLRDTPVVVRHLDPESRAAVAGARNGDLITPEYSFFFIAERWGRMFDMKVRRSSSSGSEELRILNWLPRSWKKVESYQFDR